MISSKEAILETINNIPMLSMEDLAIIFDINLITLTSKFSRMNLIKNNEIYKTKFIHNNKITTCFYAKEHKELVKNLPLHTRLQAIAYAKIISFINQYEHLECYYEEMETSLHSTNENYQSDLFLKITNALNDKKIFMLIEIETGSRSIKKTVDKYKNVMHIQKELELTKEEDENIMNIIFQYSSKKRLFSISKKHCEKLFRYKY